MRTMTEHAGILFVEDDPDMRVLLAEAIASIGYDGEHGFAEDGATALDLLLGDPAGDSGASSGDVPRLGTPPGLVFLDLYMPTVDGFEVLRQLRADERTRKLPVIVLSRHVDEPADRARLEALGATDWHRKPHRFPPLVELLAEAIDRWTGPAAHRA